MSGILRNLFVMSSCINSSLNCCQFCDMHIFIYDVALSSSFKNGERERQNYLCFQKQIQVNKMNFLVQEI